MRDGLSLLDQVLSFGEGKVTPERVRDVLGLIADDLYGEMLRLVAERDAKAVFPLVDRLATASSVLVLDGGHPHGLLTRQDVLQFLASRAPG